MLWLSKEFRTVFGNLSDLVVFVVLIRHPEIVANGVDLRVCQPETTAFAVLGKAGVKPSINNGALCRRQSERQLVFLWLLFGSMKYSAAFIDQVSNFRCSEINNSR
ncbi:hypothetical protein SynBIOSU31_01207 [Synechococcus sp. BIOS-U3-1]|nr:hypothetical protein SynBIOSU31_01207 [Synechococcus sp. BIOS-U3-1]